MLELDCNIELEIKKDEEKIINDNKLNDFINYILINENKNSDTVYYISVSIVDNKEIRVINKEYRNIDKETDVISFAYEDSEDVLSDYKVLGDIVISIDKVREQSIEYNHSFEREFYYLICHSVLHLLGYDHIKEDDKKIMREKEEFYLKNFKIVR